METLTPNLIIESTLNLSPIDLKERSDSSHIELMKFKEVTFLYLKMRS